MATQMSEIMGYVVKHDPSDLIRAICGKQSDYSDRCEQFAQTAQNHLEKYVTRLPFRI